MSNIVIPSLLIESHHCSLLSLATLCPFCNILLCSYCGENHFYHNNDLNIHYHICNDNVYLSGYGNIPNDAIEPPILNLDESDDETDDDETDDENYNTNK
jgi:hypothetical protein